MNRAERRRAGRTAAADSGRTVVRLEGDNIVFRRSDVPLRFTVPVAEVDDLIKMLRQGQRAHRDGKV